MSSHRRPRFWPQAQLCSDVCSESRCSVPSLRPAAKGPSPRSPQERPGADGSGRGGRAASYKEFRLGAERGAPPQGVAPPRFHFEETKNWGNGLPVSAVSWHDARVGRWQRGGGPEGQRPDPRRGLAALTCRGHAIVFNGNAGVSPFKLSSGVVLHKVLPPCSFLCMYNCLFIKGFEVLSQ